MSVTMAILKSSWLAEPVELPTSAIVATSPSIAAIVSVFLFTCPPYELDLPPDLDA